MRPSAVVDRRSLRTVCGARRMRAMPFASLALSIALLALTLASAARAEPAPPSLLDLSLQELSDVRVTSVAKAPQPLSAAPAAIYVIGRDDIERSGATRLVEALRLAPNLRVTQLTNTDWTVTARGLGGANDDQNFANKLLVLIDGRSVYTPLFSGVYWQSQDVPLADVERIEVISGPGATLWGANAVNGVVNVITRTAAATQGPRVQLAAGTRERRVEARYGGALGGSASFRIYGHAFEQAALRRPAGGSAGNGWRKAQGGFRVDWERGTDVVTFQGDLYRGVTSIPGSAAGELSGGNALARWSRESTPGSRLDVQAYFDQTQQFAPAGGLGFVLQTWDLQLQQTLELGNGHRLIWGAGERLNRYGIRNTLPLSFEPAARTLSHGNVFAQGEFALPHAFTLSLGFKLEDAPYSGWEPLPDVRLAWTPADGTLWWAAVSRAIRAPTPFDRDVRERVGSTVFLQGGAEFRPETLTAHQIGYRATPRPTLSWSATAFYNEYDDLRSVEPASASAPVPFRWANGMRGETYGLELWGTWQPSDRWRISPGYQWLDKRLRFDPGASPLLGVRQAGNDPEHVFTLRASWDVGPATWVDGLLRHVSALPDPKVASYTELDVQVGWRVGPSLTLALRGQSLLHARHRENAPSFAQDIPRSALLEARWEF